MRGDGKDFYTRKINLLKYLKFQLVCANIFI